jgi:hypothetical protein
MNTVGWLVGFILSFRKEKRIIIQLAVFFKRLITIVKTKQNKNNIE